MTVTRGTPKLRVWVRDLHLYGGLFISPFVLVFAVSTILLNHTWTPWTKDAEAAVRTVAIRGPLPQGLGRLERGRWVAGQAGVTGEIANVWVNGEVITVPVVTPGRRVTIRADLAAGTARIQSRDASLWERLIYLHKSPGPHLAGFRGNWVFTRIWRGLADATVALVLLSTATGVYLWLLIRSQRRTGLALVGAGALTFAGLVLALVA